MLEASIIISPQIMPPLLCDKLNAYDRILKQEELYMKEQKYSLVLKLWTTNRGWIQGLIKELREKIIEYRGKRVGVSAYCAGIWQGDDDDTPESVKEGDLFVFMDDTPANRNLQCALLRGQKITIHDF